jgi:cytoskeleton protein RodZ
MIAKETDKELQQAGLPTESGGIKAVGTWLKAAREMKGETLNDISLVTRIGKSYLEAIEDGLLSKLPSPAYTRGFIRLYAAHLGLSPDEAMLILDRDKTAKSDKSVAPIDSTTRSTHRSIIGPASPKRNRLLILLILSSCIAAALFFFTPSKNTILTQKPAQSPLIAPPHLENIQKDAADPTTANSPPVPSAVKIGEKPAANGIVLRLKAVSDGKLHITIDGAVSQEYDLVAGDLVEWKAEKAFLLDIENAASVEGELNGVLLKPFGEQGKPAHMLISGDGAHNE